MLAQEQNGLMMQCFFTWCVQYICKYIDVVYEPSLYNFPTQEIYSSSLFINKYCANLLLFKLELSELAHKALVFIYSPFSNSDAYTDLEYCSYHIFYLCIAWSVKFCGVISTLKFRSFFWWQDLTMWSRLASAFLNSPYWPQSCWSSCFSLQRAGFTG